MNPDRPPLFSTATACVLAGITYRQVDYWDRCGYVHPAVEAKGSGSRRLYTAQQVAVLAVLAKVSGAIPIGRLAGLAAFLTDWPMGEWDGWLLIEPDGQIWRRDADSTRPAVATAIYPSRLIPEAVRAAIGPADHAAISAG